MKAKKIIIPISIVAGIAVIGVAVSALSGAASATNFTDVSLIEQQEFLRNYISVTGTVESGNFNQVYSTLNYPVESVSVEIGDTVKKGDILCTLDTDALQTQILQQQANVDSSDISSQYQLTQAEKDYNAALEDYSNGTNQDIVSAIYNLEDAAAKLEKAQKDYDEAVALSDDDKSLLIKSAEITLEDAENTLVSIQNRYDKSKEVLDNEDYYSIESLKKAYDEAKKVFNDSKTNSNATKEAYDQYNKALEEYTVYSNYPETIPFPKEITYYREALSRAEANLLETNETYQVTNAKENYQNALTAYEKAKNDIDKSNLNSLSLDKIELDRAKAAVENAKITLQKAKDENSNGIITYKENLAFGQLAYEKAKENYNITTKAVESNLAKLKTNAERERTLSGLNDSSLITLESLKEQLDEAVIKAPCDGTVTMVGATIGSNPTGTLFAIEDEADLKVTAKLREYDVASVSVGMPVIVKTDAAKDVEYQGIVTKIAPTAVKNLDGTDAGTALFEVEIAVTSKDTALKIGMTAKLQIVTEEVDNVLAVAYDSITTDENGNDIVYIAEKSDLGYVAKAVAVTVGIQTDFFAEVTGDGISDGTIVINDIEFIADGQSVLIDEAELDIDSVSSDITEGEQAE